MKVYIIMAEIECEGSGRTDQVTLGVIDNDLSLPEEYAATMEKYKKQFKAEFFSKGECDVKFVDIWALAYDLNEIKIPELDDDICAYLECDCPGYVDYSWLSAPGVG